MFFGNKKRETTKKLFKAIYAPYSLAENRREGISKDNFREYIAKIELERRMKKFKRSKCNINVKILEELEHLIEDCEEDGYIKSNKMDKLRITSRGKEYISWKYYPQVILNYWLTKVIVTNIIAFLIGFYLGKAMK